MPITQAGALNTTALTVPNIYVNVVPPALLLNGVPSNILGIVGTATWGPVNTPTVASGPSDATAAFGPMQPRKYDLGTHVFTSAQQGANSYMLVRATDGTDTAATATIQTTGLTLTARYTGSLGNSIQVAIAPGSKTAGTFKITISMGSGIATFPAPPPEVFDNIGAGLTGNAIWVALANAINNGLTALRGPSKIVIATAGALTAAPATAAFTLAGGTDGASTPAAVAATPTILTGVDVAPRTGLFALRGRSCSVVMVADMDTSSAWTTVDGFAVSEAGYAVQCGPAGDTLTNAQTVLQTAGIDSYATKMMFGDWVWITDPVNLVTRLVSPQGFVAGRLAALAPNQSSLNKQLYGIAGTQKSGAPGTTQAQSYAAADLSALFSAGIDVIGSPSPGGNYYSVLDGHNTSSNAAVSGDSYTRMTNYLAATLNVGMGKYVGQPITTALLNNITATLNGFCQALVTQGLLTPNLDGSMPYLVVCNASNNLQSRTSLGYVQADVQVTYEGINEKFLVNLQGGATVVTTKQPALGAV